MSITKEQLDEIKKLAEAATPGPWRTVVDEFDADSGAHQVALHDCFSEQDAEKNAAFIVAMREHALPLVKALEEAWKERDEARAEVELLRAEVRKQVFGSRVVFDREVAERAQAALEAALKGEGDECTPKHPYPSKQRSRPMGDRRGAEVGSRSRAAERVGGEP